ncbi:hypothetical protein K9L97_02430 [Candidatus Woesearchaeota archaeon]|nr:hypothetical protein [Candidatus Woesearchaeota archaeon]
MNNINDFAKSINSVVDFEYILKDNNYYFITSTQKYFIDADDRMFPSGFLGRIKKRFEPSLFLLELLSKNSDNKIFINDTAEFLFLCGRDVFKENITRNNSNKEIFFVQNKFDENLGFGTFFKQDKQVLVRNIKDRGDFLRREMNK